MRGRKEGSEEEREGGRDVREREGEGGGKRERERERE
jgi:hypothetical protein